MYCVLNMECPLSEVPLYKEAVFISTFVQGSCLKRREREREEGETWEKGRERG